MLYLLLRNQLVYSFAKFVFISKILSIFTQVLPKNLTRLVSVAFSKSGADDQMKSKSE